MQEQFRGPWRSPAPLPSPITLNTLCFCSPPTKQQFLLPTPIPLSTLLRAVHSVPLPLLRLKQSGELVWGCIFSSVNSFSSFLSRGDAAALLICSLITQHCNFSLFAHSLPANWRVAFAKSRCHLNSLPSPTGSDEFALWAPAEGAVGKHWLVLENSQPPCPVHWSGLRGEIRALAVSSQVSVTEGNVARDAGNKQEPHLTLSKRGGAEQQVSGSF